MSKSSKESAKEIRTRLKPGSKVSLAAIDPQADFGLDKNTAKEETEALQQRLIELQNVLYADGKQSLLTVFQAMDAGGKDGAIRNVFSGVNPQGVRVASFKTPTPLELSHDFLWRIHAQVPPRGMIGVFNRSHYEDVLIVRVNELVPESVWRARYAHINDFEQLLSESGVHILKFFLHISKEEQKERLVDRLNSPDEQWKFSTGDIPVRERWDDYMHAYEDALTECNTDHAPWHVIPSNRKWLRNLLILRVVVAELESLDLRYPDPEPGLDKVVIPD